MLRNASRALTLGLAIIATGVQAHAETGADRVAQLLEAALKAPQAQSARFDLAIEWDQRANRTEIGSFTRQSDHISLRREATLAGRCDVVKALERGAFVRQLPHLQAPLEDPQLGASVEIVLLRALAPSRVCEANRAITEALNLLGEETRNIFPLRLGDGDPLQTDRSRLSRIRAERSEDR